jgi:hypothetical protein
MKVFFYIIIMALAYILFTHYLTLFLYLVGAVLGYKLLVGSRSQREMMYYNMMPEYMRGILAQMQKMNDFLESLEESQRVAEMRTEEQRNPPSSEDIGAEFNNRPLHGFMNTDSSL